MNAATLPGKASVSSTRGQRPRDETLVSLFLVMLTLGAFLPALGNRFVNFDDPLFVTENPHVLGGLSATGLRWAWSNIHAGYWQPLTWMSLQLDAQLFGDQPWGYHLTNCLWHAANGVLFFWTLRRLTGSTWRSAAAAAFFVVHPLRVESVAWVAERKDVLSTFFGLLTMLAYAAYCRRPGLVSYSLLAAAFTAGLLAKPMLVTLPVVLLLLDYWPLGRLSAAGAGVEAEGAARPVPLVRLVLEKLPLLAIALAVSAITIYAQWRGEALVSLERLPLSYRLGNAVLAYGWYLGKTFWPSGLAAMYPHVRSGLSWWEVAGVLALLAAVSLFSLMRRRQPYLLVGWLWFLGTLIPVIGLLQAGDQRWADRFTYVPHLGLLLMLVWGTHDLLDCWRVPGPAQGWAVSAILIPCTVATWVQTARWHDSVSIFKHTLQVTTENAPGHCALGVALLDEGETVKAIRHFREAVLLDPDYARAHYNLGFALFQMGEMSEAISAYRDVVRLDPRMSAAQYNLGMALMHQGRAPEAVGPLREAVRLRPDAAASRYTLAVALVESGRGQEAGPHFSEALRLSADYLRQQFSFAMLLAAHGLPAEAVAHYQAALETSPGVAVIHYHLGRAWAALGDWPAAAAAFGRAVALDPSVPFPHAALAWALRHHGQEAGSREEYRLTLQLDPHWPRTAARQAWTLATHVDGRARNGPWALALAEQAAQLSENNEPDVLDALAAAHAELGDYHRAATTARRAQALASTLGQSTLASQIEGRLHCYEKQTPFRAAGGAEK